MLPPANTSDFCVAVVDTKGSKTAATAQKGQDRKQKARTRESSSSSSPSSSSPSSFSSSPPLAFASAATASPSPASPVYTASAANSAPLQSVGVTTAHPPAEKSKQRAAAVDTKVNATAATDHKSRERKPKAGVQEPIGLGVRAAQIAQRLIKEQQKIVASSDDNLFKLQWYMGVRRPTDSGGIDLTADEPGDDPEDAPLVKLVRRAFDTSDSVGHIVSEIMDDAAGNGPTFLAWRQMVAKDITETKAKTSPYNLTSPDGLCGYRAAYQIYLVSLGKEPRDVNLRDPSEAAEFLQWLREGAERAEAPIAKEAIDLAIKWIEDNYVKSQKGGFFSGVVAHTWDNFGWCNAAYWSHLLPDVNWQLLTQGSKGLCPLEHSRQGVGPCQIFARLLESASAFHFAYFGDAHFWLPKAQRRPSESGRTTDDSDRVMSALRNVTEALVKEIRRRLGEEDKKAASFVQLRKDIEKRELSEQEIPDLTQRLRTAVERELGGCTQWVLGSGKDPSREECWVSCSLFKSKRQILCLVCGGTLDVRSAKTHSKTHAEAQLEALKRPRERSKATKVILAALGSQTEVGQVTTAGGGGGGSQSGEATVEESVLASTTYLFLPSTDPEPSSGGARAE